MVLEIKKIIPDIETGIIAHQVCCTGVLHTGLGKAIAAKWSRVESEYQRFCGPDAGRERFPAKFKWFGLARLPSFGCAIWRVKTYTGARNAIPITMP